MYWLRVDENIDVSDVFVNNYPKYEIEKYMALYTGKIMYKGKRMTPSGHYVWCGESRSKNYLKKLLDKVEKANEQ